MRRIPPLAATLLAAAVAAAPRPARAEGAAAGPRGVSTAGDATQGEASPPRAARPDAPPRGTPLEVEVHGEVFFGVSADGRDGWARDVGLSRARLEVVGRLDRMQTVIEADLADERLLKDAYVRLDGPAATRLTAGRFKAPFLERETASTWRLPLVSRGLVDDYLVDRNELGGRRIGAVGEVRPWDGALSVAAGVFQGTAPDDEARPPQDYVARLAVRPARGLTLGVAGYRAGTRGAPARRAASAFAQGRYGPLGATLEAVAGDVVQGAFAAGLALVEVRLRLPRELALTPVAGFEALRLRGPEAATGTAAVAGLVLAHRDALKLKVQGERARRPGDAAPESAIAVELATRF